MSRVEYVPFGRLRDVKDKELCLTKPGKSWDSDYKIIRFASRHALEEFNKKAGLKPLVYTIVPKNMAIYAHEKEVE